MSLELLRAMKLQLDAQQDRLTKLDAYYEGRQPLNYLHPDVQNRVGRRLSPLVINWPRVIVSSIEERLDVQGFGSGGENDDRLWDWWQANDLDEWSQLGHTDAMVHGRAYASVWGDDDRPGLPKICVESAHQMTVTYEPGSRNLSAALKVWFEVEPFSQVVRESYAVLYLPDSVEKWQAAGQSGDWKLIEVLRNPLGRVPVEPIVNRPRLTDLLGESELCDVLPIADAVNKLATDMMVSSEFHAMPRRWITGLEIPRDPAAQKKLDQDVMNKLADAYPGKPWLGGGGANMGQFPEASLDNFINAIKLLTSQIAAIAGLPPHYLGINADNPASAEAIRSAEASLVHRAKRKQKAFGGSWERVMRLAVDVIDGAGAGQKLDDLETDWVSASTPTPAEAADAAIKLTQGERPVITIQQAREDLGYTPQQIEQMNLDDQRAATSTVRAQLDLAQQLQAEQGLSQAASYAAVGLLQAAAQISATPAA